MVYILHKYWILLLLLRNKRTLLVIRKPQIEIRFYFAILEWQNFGKELMVHSIGKRVKKVVHIPN